MRAPNLATARSAWGRSAPEWVIALAEECDRSSQGRAAKRLGVSSTVINQALHNSYPGRLDRIEQRVRGEFMREVVACSVLGEITKRECMDHQARGYEATNPMRVRLFQACRRCATRRTL